MTNNLFFELFDGHKFYCADYEEQYKKVKSLDYDKLSEVFLDNDSEESESFFRTWYECIDNTINISKNVETFISKNYYIRPVTFSKPWGWARDLDGDLYLMCPKGTLLGPGNKCISFRFWIVKKKPESYQEFYNKIYIGQGIYKAREHQGWEV